MKVSVETLEESQVELSIEAEPQEMGQALEQSYRSLASRASIPGFRKGKAPRELLERRLGQPAILQKALEFLVPELYSKALQERGIRAMGEPQVQISSTDPIAFKVKVSVWPQVKLGEYHLLHLEPELVAVPDEEIEATLEQIRRQNTPWEPVERPAAQGDLLIIDVQGRSNGRAILKENSAQFQLLDGWPYPVPGFSQQLIGLEAGQSKEFTLSFPPDNPSPTLAGKEFSFKVKVNEIKEQRLPELNDELAKGVGHGFESLDALRQNLAQTLRQQAEAEVRSRLAEKALDGVVAGASLQLPEAMVEAEVDRLLEERRQVGGMEAQLQTVGRSPEETRQELRPTARERLTRSLVLAEVAKEEGIEITQEELEAEAQRLVQAQGESGLGATRLLQNEDFRNSLTRVLLVRKTKDKLAGIALGEKASARLAKAGLWVPGQGTEPAPPQAPPTEQRPSGLWLPGTPTPEKTDPKPT